MGDRYGQYQSTAVAQEEHLARLRLEDGEQVSSLGDALNQGFRVGVS